MVYVYCLLICLAVQAATLTALAVAIPRLAKHAMQSAIRPPTRKPNGVSTLKVTP